MNANPGGFFSKLKERMRNMPAAIDRAVIDQSEQRARSAQGVGLKRSEDFYYSQPADTLARRMINDRATPGVTGALGVEDLAKMLEDQTNRRAMAQAVVPQLNRGFMGMTRMGTMEAINTGIATNPWIRRGALPGAIGTGGVLAGAAITPAAQQLMALMGFMRQGQETAQARDESPLIQQG